MGHTCERMRLKLHHSVGAHGLCQPTAWGPQGGRARSCSTHLSIAVKPYTHIGMVYGVWENTNLCRRNTQFVSITYLICESWKTCTLSMLSAHRNFPAKVKTSKVFNIKCAPWWSFHTHSHTHTLHFNVWINASHTIVYDQHGQFFFVFAFSITPLAEWIDQAGAISIWRVAASRSISR